MDFISTYMPAFVELQPTTIADTRDRLERFARAGWPDLDTSPNTVLGDLILTPQAYQIAAIEEGMDRFMSDLNLGNVANDIIYNCDFVEQYLKNFATDQSTILRASGTVRLVFVADKNYMLDRSVRFSFRDAVFSIYLPNNGPFTIYRTGSTVADGENGTVLKDSGSGVYFADVPVLGNSGESTVTTGTAGLISIEIPELGSISALADFNPGTDEATLPKLAQRTRETIYAASLNTRNGAVRYVKDICPFVESIYATHNGDREMVREYHNPWGTSTGCLDIYARSQSYDFTETQNVKLYLSNDKTKFEGPFPYVGQPYYIESVTHAGYNQPQLAYKITSTNTRNLGALAAYTKFEKLDLEVDNMTDENGGSLFTVNIDAEGKKYAYFIVTYHTDPMLPSIGSTVENADYLPINTSILMRGFIPVVIERFEVVYVKKPGVVPLLDEAKDAIKIYLGKLGAPDVYSEASIAQIMAEAGVKYMKDIRVKAHVQWSVADEIMDYDGNIVPVPSGPEIRDSASLRITYPARSVDTDADTMYACSVRNIRYYLKENAVSFNEVKDI